VEEDGFDPEAAPAGAAGAGVPPLTAGVPASAPAAAVPGGQLGAGATTAPAGPLLCADPTDAEHELPEFSPDELTVGPLPEGAVLVADGVVVAGGAGGDADGAGEDARGAGEDAGGGVDGVDAVTTSEAVPAGQSVDPARAPPAVESRAAACVVMTAPASAAVAEGIGGEQTVRARTALDVAPRNRTATASESKSRQILLVRRAGDGTAKRTMR
jgi:hypothetical protein